MHINTVVLVKLYGIKFIPVCKSYSVKECMVATKSAYLNEEVSVALHNIIHTAYHRIYSMGSRVSIKHKTSTFAA